MSFTGRRRWCASMALLAAGFSCSTARADVEAIADQSFETSNVALINADPQQVFAALSRIGAWWDPHHTFSGDARNLSLELRPGGCLCERLPGGGGVLHLTVVNVEPGKILRLRGALGPLQNQAVDGAMTWTIEPDAHGSKVSLTYVVSGDFSGGAKNWAEPVDHVLGAQLARLKSFTEHQNR